MVIVVLLDGARCPAKCSLRLPKTGRVSDLVRVSTVSALLGREPTREGDVPLPGEMERGKGGRKEREGQVALA